MWLTDGGLYSNILAFLFEKEYRETRSFRNRPMPRIRLAQSLTPTVSQSASVDEGIRHKDLGKLTEGDEMQHTFLNRNTN